MVRHAHNPFRQDLPDWSAPELSFVDRIARQEARELHRCLPGYEPTPLRPLPELARELGVGQLWVKDEASRFGLGAFKGLGASFAVYSVLARRWSERTGEPLPPRVFGDPASLQALGPITLTAATDGNHGRAVAWTARLLGLRAVIYMPDDTSPARIESIEAEGAEVRRIEGTFDDCVEACAHDAVTHDRQVIADTAYPGNMELPGFIMAGYATLFAEIDEQLDEAADLVLLPAGVGGLAGAGVAWMVRRHGADRPRIVCVEPEASACFLESILEGDGRPHAAHGDQRSIMAGLNCGLPSALAWPLLRDAVDDFLALEDSYAERAVRTHHRHGIVSGESGAATLAGLIALREAPELEGARATLELDGHRRVLLINTEGATDPEGYRSILAEGSVSS